MPNKPDPKKKFISFLLPRELIAKLQQEADTRKTDRTGMVVELLEWATRNTELPQDVIEQINEDVKQQIEKRQSRFPGYAERKQKLMRSDTWNKGVQSSKVAHTKKKGKETK